MHSIIVGKHLLSLPSIPHKLAGSALECSELYLSNLFSKERTDGTPLLQCQNPEGVNLIVSIWIKILSPGSFLISNILEIPIIVEIFLKQILWKKIPH